MYAFKKQFNEHGHFKALEACERWLYERGYSYSSASKCCPVAVLKGRYDIAKWKNLSRAEIHMLDGQITGDIRKGPLTLLLKIAPENQ